MTALRFTTLAIVFTLFTSGFALAGPPLVTDDAGTVETGKVEIELNGSYAFENEDNHGAKIDRDTADTEVKITTGIYKNLGISLIIPYTLNNRERVDGALTGTSEGFGDMRVELKYAFAELAGINLAIKPAVIMPTGKYSAGLSEGRWQPGVTLIATKEFDEGTYALHTNLGYEHHDYRVDADLQRSDLFSGSIAGEMKVLKGLTIVADFGLATNPDKASNELPVYALTGARYEINEHLDINAGIKLGLTKPEDDVAILYGLVLKF